MDRSYGMVVPLGLYLLIGVGDNNGTPVSGWPCFTGLGLNY